MCLKWLELGNGQWPREAVIIYDFKEDSTFSSSEILAPLNFFAQISFLVLGVESSFWFSIGKSAPSIIYL